ncbi:MAG TPA: hypothetical protein VF399_04255 [bacterium]
MRSFERLKKCLALSVIVIGCTSSPPAVPSGTDDTPIDILSDPRQEIINSPDSIKIKVSDIDFAIALRATYAISGIVLSKKNYRSGWSAMLAPCDFALGWGDLVKDETYKQLHWSQSNRWYHWRYGSGFTRDNNFVARYSSNNHIVPATENLARAVKSLKRGDVVELGGYLVNINGNKDGTPYWWCSSVRRDDTGDNSCEVIYVTRLRTKGLLFE